MCRRVLLLVCSMILLAACGSNAAAPQTAAPSPQATGAGCADVAKPAPKSAEISEPTGALAAGKTYVVRLDTSCGQIDIQLDQAKNPQTANSFAHLAREGYFNGTAFHRVVPGFVIQGGDPAGDGTGGPSWKVTEAPPADTQYLQGVVAMAKTAAEEAGTSGSQFFIVEGADAGLPADYAVAGRVVAGQDVVQLIAALGSAGADGPPSKPVVINSASVTES